MKANGVPGRERTDSFNSDEQVRQDDGWTGILGGLAGAVGGLARTILAPLNNAIGSVDLNRRRQEHTNPSDNNKK